MKYHKKRRFGALVLALAMALSLAAPVWAADTEPKLTIAPSGPLELEVGASEELTAKLENGPADTVTVTYKWECLTADIVTFGSADASTTKVTAGDKATTSPATIKVTASWPDNSDPGNPTTKEVKATCSLTIKEKADNPDSGITLIKQVLN